MCSQGDGAFREPAMTDQAFTITAYAAMLFTLVVTLTAIAGLVERLT